MTTLADCIVDFYFSLPKDCEPPGGVEIIYPYDNSETRRVMETFYRKYYDDTRPRRLLFGINPGRNGAGLTGVGFTDPILMETKCGIANSLEKRSELSATFICEVVEAYGGPEAFYGDFLFTTVLPFGLLKDGKNYNYYDDKETLAYFEPLIVESIRKQTAYPNISRRIATVGQGKNLTYLEHLDAKYRFFDAIEALPHPRWVMQYRRKEKAHYIQTYLRTLRSLRKS